MNESVPPKDENDEQTSQFRFSLATLMLFMLVVCISAAIGSYLINAGLKNTRVIMISLIFTVLSPPLLLVVMNVVHKLLLWKRKKQ